DRAGAVKRLMRSDLISFVVLTGPERASLDEGLFFHERLAEESMPFGCFVVNRTRRPFTSDPVATASKLRAATSSDRDAIEPLVRNFERYHVLASRDAAEIAKTRTLLGDTALRQVPDFEEDIHDLRGLHRYADHLLAADSPS
ncbi:MAG: anion-transporting ArsA/GET3 family ATPase, partial [Myxococcota bacterium]